MHNRIKFARTDNLSTLTGDNLNLPLKEGQPFYDKASNKLYIGQDENSALGQCKDNTIKPINANTAKYAEGDNSGDTLNERLTDLDDRLDDVEIPLNGYDNTKGTIEERLTSLGFRHGDIVSPFDVTNTIGEITRQGNYIILNIPEIETQQGYLRSLTFVDHQTHTTIGDFFRPLNEIPIGPSSYSYESSSVYSSFTSTSDYIGYFMSDSDHTQVTESNKDSLGIVPGTTPCQYKSSRLQCLQDVVMPMSSGSFTFSIVSIEPKTTPRGSIELYIENALTLTGTLRFKDLSLGYMAKPL